MLSSSQSLIPEAAGKFAPLLEQGIYIKYKDHSDGAFMACCSGWPECKGEGSPFLHVAHKRSVKMSYRIPSLTVVLRVWAAACI